MSFSTRHLDRVRAESFGAAAQDYDRYRPEYPSALIDDLARLGGAGVLDVGCGTGKAAAALSARGLSVLGIEPDDRMAEIARRKGVAVETATFETWQPGQRRFDLLVSADAWHWLHPAASAQKAADLLATGGHLARFWSYHVLDDAVLEELRAVYSEHAPGVQVAGDRQKSTDGVRDPVVDEMNFVGVTQQKYRWSLALDANEWLGLIGTFSDHRRMAPPARTALFDRVREVVEERGGAVRTASETFLQLARRM